MSKAKKSDPRVERTKLALVRAMIDLMLEQDFDTVTVQDLLDRAKVGRSTFYTHFSDKEDLMRKSIVGMKDQILEHCRMEEARGNVRPGDFTAVLFYIRHVGLNQKIHNAIMGRDIEPVVDRGMKRAVCEMIRFDLELRTGVKPPKVYSEGAIQFLASGLLSLIRWWGDNEIDMTPEQIHELFVALANKGVNPLFPNAANSSGVC